MTNNPLPDAALAELDRLFAERNEGDAHMFNWRQSSIICYPALRQRLTEAESRLAEAERGRAKLAWAWNEVQSETAAEAADKAKLINASIVCLDSLAWLAARDAQQRREGAIEALEGIAKDEGIDGGKAYIAKVVYREFPDLMHTSVGVVDASDLMAAAKRLRERGE